MTIRFAAKTLLASATAGLIAFAVAPANAGLNAPRSVAVPYTDLDLKTDGGQAQLKRRIAYAAQTVCGPADMLSYSSKKWVGACQTRAIANASRAMVEVFADAGSTIRVAAN